MGVRRSTRFPLRSGSRFGLFYLTFHHFFYAGVINAESSPSLSLHEDGNVPIDVPWVDNPLPRNDASTTLYASNTCTYTGNLSLMLSDYTQGAPKVLHTLIMPVSIKGDTRGDKLEKMLQWSLNQKHDEWLQICTRYNPPPVGSAQMPDVAERLGRSAAEACLDSLQDQFRDAFTATCRSKSFAFGSEALPRIIWAYWDDETTLPWPVRDCIATWHVHAPEWEIRLVHATTVSTWLDEGEDYPAEAWNRTAANQSDLFGIALLRRYGGLYLDATIVLTQSLGWLEQLFASLRTGHFGYKTHENKPEIFAVASVAHGHCITAWWRTMYFAWMKEAAGSALTTDSGVDLNGGYPDIDTHLQASVHGFELMKSDGEFHRCVSSSLRASAPYLLTVAAMVAAKITDKKELVPTLATRLGQPLPAEVIVQPLHKIQGAAVLPADGLKVAPGSWWSQITQQPRYEPPRPDHIVHHENEVVVSRGRYGLSVVDASDQWVGESLQLFGEWEQPVLDVASRVLGSGDTVWEGGAHVGSHTIGLANFVGKTGRVHAFEPSPEARLLLSSAVALNGLQHRVAVHGIALGDHEQDGKVLVADISTCNYKWHCDKNKEGVNSGAVSLRKMGIMNEGTPLKAGQVLATVAIHALDTYAASGFLDGEQCPRLIKFDLEGMDFQGLRGAAQAISTCKPYLYFEVMSPRSSATNIDDLLDRHPEYSCAWHFFRVIPSYREAFRSTDDFRQSPQNDVLRRHRGGPLSMNMFCAPQSQVVSEFRGLNLVPYVDSTTDVFYPLDDCDEIEHIIRTSGRYAELVGSNVSMCVATEVMS